MKINLPITDKEQCFEESERIISTTDHKGAITSYNEDFLKISGFEAEELDGKNHNIVRHPDMPAAAFEDLWKTVKNGQSWMGIVKNRCKNGDHYWVDAFVTPITENGEVVEYQSVRSKPSAERVKRAEAIYQRFNNKKKPFRPQLSLRHKLYLSTVISLLPILITSELAPHLTWLGALFSVILGFGLTSWLLKPLHKLCQQTKTQVDNPLMSQIYTGRTDEIGQLMLANKMVNSQLDAVVSRLRYSTGQLTETAANASSISQQSNDSIQKQQHTVNEITTAVNEMNSAILEVAQNTQQAAQSAQQADNESNKGKKTAGNTIQAIKELAENIGTAACVVNRLDEESKGISSVLDVIREIAEQTNLLALNAAIEAARAGEHGRGFAVVADEVRTLAVRTQDSIAEIESMIIRVQGSVHEATSTMEESRCKADDCSKQSSAISEFLNTITNSVATISDMTTQIANAAEEQGSVSVEVKNNVNTLSEQSLQSVEITKQSDQISHTLTELTLQLKKLVHQFQ